MMSVMYKSSITKVSMLKCQTRFFLGLKRRPSTTTAVIIMVTNTDNKCEGEMFLNNEPSL